MIKTIVKRKGQTEPFMVEKINGWWMWALKTHDIPPGEGLEAVNRAISTMPEVCTSEKLQRALITELLALNRWNSVKLAGSLEASLAQKQVYPEGIPSFKEQCMKMFEMKKMKFLDYSDEEWLEMNSVIDHQNDFLMPQFSVSYLMNNYAIRNVADNKRLETPQFTLARMAAAVAEEYPKGEERLFIFKDIYDLLTKKVLSLPTPNYNNLGTPDGGLSSCCLYSAKDDRKSLAAAEHITYVQTYCSAGLGYEQSVRSIGDPVRGGTIEHQGEQFYLRSNAASAAANRRQQRGGAINAFISGYSKEAISLLAAREPTAPVDSALLGIDVSITINKDLLVRANKDEDSLHFSNWSQPELYNLLYSADTESFSNKIASVIKENKDPKLVFSPRKLFSTIGRTTNSSGRNYVFLTDNANYHTPYKEPIRSSNLCMEIMQATKPYDDIMDLYKESDDVTGEVSMCNLAAINHDKVADDPELHKRACLAALRVIDYCIRNNKYELPHIGYTAKKRNNAAVGVMNTATYMARKRLSYSSKEGLEHMHDFAERQMYYLIEASLQLGKEFGNAEWINKTKWAGYTNKKGEYIKAWMPIDTQNQRLSKELNILPKQNWEELRDQVAENKGIRNTTVFGLMPGESSSKGLGTCNSVFPARNISLLKTDGTSAIDWFAECGDHEEYLYESAFDLGTENTIKFYSVWQMWMDNGISADFWVATKSPVIKIEEVLKKYSMMYAYGMKSHYYTVAKTQASKKERDEDDIEMLDRAKMITVSAEDAFPDLYAEGPVCTSGGCGS
jgi:ribonucleoside-diphosphate reductase alpha chain